MEPKLLPKHIAIIMDGNRRWARQHGMEVFFGHEYMVDKAIEPLVDHCIDRGIECVTLWAFSTENWKRDRKEVDFLLMLFRRVFSKNSQRLHERGVRLKMIGDPSAFPEDLQQSMAEWIEKTKDNDKITVVFALNYGGRDEILRAAGKLIKQAGGQVKMADEKHAWTVEEFEAALDTTELPAVDLIIRPGGEQRLSGFLLWQSEYAELYFPEVMMPDFNPSELDKALEEFARRQRRFGG